MWKHGVIPNNWLIIGYFSCLPKLKIEELPAADVGKGQTVGLRLWGIRIRGNVIECQGFWPWQLPFGGFGHRACGRGFLDGH